MMEDMVLVVKVDFFEELVYEVFDGGGFEGVMFVICVYVVF